MGKKRGPDWNRTGVGIKPTMRAIEASKMDTEKNSGNDRTAPVHGSPVVQIRISRSDGPLDGFAIVRRIFYTV